MYLFNKHTLLIWIVVWLLPLSAMAKRPFVETGCVTSLELQGGNSAVWGWYGAVGMSAYYSLPQYFAVQGGVQYNITNCVVADVRPAFIYHIASGRLHIEALCHYTMVQHSHNRYALALEWVLQVSIFGAMPDIIIARWAYRRLLLPSLSIFTMNWA